MKARITRLNFRKDPSFDPNGVIDDHAAMPFLLELKKNWWGRWRYVMDEETGMPRLFFGRNSLAIFIYQHDITQIKWA